MESFVKSVWNKPVSGPFKFVKTSNDLDLAKLFTKRKISEDIGSVLYIKHKQIAGLAARCYVPNREFNSTRFSDTVPEKSFDLVIIDLRNVIALDKLYTIFDKVNGKQKWIIMNNLADDVLDHLTLIYYNCFSVSEVPQDSFFCLELYPDPEVKVKYDTASCLRELSEKIHVGVIGFEKLKNWYIHVNIMNARSRYNILQSPRIYYHSTPSSAVKGFDLIMNTRGIVPKETIPYLSDFVVSRTTYNLLGVEAIKNFINTRGEPFTLHVL